MSKPMTDGLTDKQLAKQVSKIKIDPLVTPRDPARRARILALIADIWKYGSDLRLGQILVNATGHRADMFFYEDKELEDDLEYMLEGLKGNHAEPFKKS